MICPVLAEHLTKRYRRVVAVDDVSFRVEAGSVTAFLGPNGAGKTTTLRMLLGLVAPSGGEALIFGSRYGELTEPARRVGAVLDVAAHPGRTARDHLRLLALPMRVGRRRVDAVLEAVGLAEAAERRIGTFSLGMRQRLGLAGALLGDPELLLLDEPANGLDPEGIRWLREFLADWAADGRAVLLSSHVLAEVAQVADRIVVVKNGQVVLEGAANEILRGSVDVRSPQADKLAVLLGDIDGLVHTDDGGLRLPHGWAEHVGRVAAAHGIPLVELHTSAGDLESVFFSLVDQ